MFVCDNDINVFLAVSWTISLSSSPVSFKERV